MRNKLLVVGCALLCFYLSYTAINTDVGSDPKLTLLVSQALVDDGTVRLDAYVDDQFLDEPFAVQISHGFVLLLNDHYYNYYPVGPSLISAPFVALARLSGLDMRTTDNYAFQRMLAALTTVLAFGLVYALARCYVPAADSLIIALVSTLGSSLISTMGTALWSHNYVVIFTGLALWLLARQESGRATTVHPVWLGLLLFLVFLCRASTAAFILPVLLYLLWTDRRAAVITGTVAFVGLMGFLGWSAARTGQLLPEYYNTGRLQAARAPLWVGIVGNLISPSRGIFIFSPFLIPVFGGLLLRGHSLFRRPLVWLCLLWFALNFWVVARAASWWGGWSFGPRILTDIWPGLVLLTAIVWQALRRPLPASLTAKLFAIAYTLLGFLAILLHVGLGLNSQVASRWNGSIVPQPQAGEPPLGDLFNWHYAQPLASNRMLCELGSNWFATAVATNGLPLVTYSPGQPVYYDGDLLVPWPAPKPVKDSQAAASLARDAVAAEAMLPIIARPGNTAAFRGWGAPHEESRWSQCYDSQIYLQLGALPAGERASLTVTGGANGPQEIEVTVNGRPIGSLYRTSIQQTTSLDFPSTLLEPEALNIINLHFPDAHYPSIHDQRPLGLSFYSLVLDIH